MSYPFFDCVVCGGRVQKAVICIPGSLPPISYLDRGSSFSSSFDNASEFVRHCRGQVSRYWDDGQEFHFQFSGCFAGRCCFCALNAGLGLDVFTLNGCYNCTRKEKLRAEFAKLVQRSDQSTAMTWASHGWGALPSTLIDYILVFAMGMEGCAKMAVIRDGRVCAGKWP